MSEAGMGRRTWLIPDCYWPMESDPGAPYVSHEAICVLNAGDRDARIRIVFYFEDREPMTAFAGCPARRTHHVRLDALATDGGPLPKGEPYAALVHSDVPVAVQYSRCDASHPAVTLMTTMAHAL